MSCGGEHERHDDEGDEEEEEEGGYGGIKNQSVDEIIAKARFTETFLAASVTIGLTDDLDELAKLGEMDEDGIVFVTLCFVVDMS